MSILRMSYYATSDTINFYLFRLLVKRMLCVAIKIMDVRLTHYDVMYCVTYACNYMPPIPPIPFSFRLNCMLHYSYMF